MPLLSFIADVICYCLFIHLAFYFLHSHCVEMNGHIKHALRITHANIWLSLAKLMILIPYCFDNKTKYNSSIIQIAALVEMSAMLCQNLDEK